MTHHRDRALLLMEQGRAGMAQDELRQALRDDPDDPFLHALLALCLSDLGDRVGALDEAQLATVHGPDVPFAHYALATVLLQAERPDEADQAARLALGLDPYEADYHAVLAAAQSNENKERLRRETDAAWERGIFGAPTFEVAGELFWGNDRLEDAFAWSARQ